MPVHNAERLVRQAVESIRTQTFSDFELIVVDDGSTDGTAQALRNITDPRLVLVSSPSNEGVARALNRGLQAVRGAYVARMDADDLSMSGRLAAQVAYLDVHPEIGVVGTCVGMIDGDGTEVGPYACPEDPVMIDWGLQLRNMLVHSAVMYRRDTVLQAGGYSLNHLHAEDFELWTRLAKVTRITVLPEKFVLYRKHAESISTRASERQDVTATQIAARQVRELLGTEPALPVLRGMRQLARAYPRGTWAIPPEAVGWLRRMGEAYCRKRALTPELAARIDQSIFDNLILHACDEAGRFDRTAFDAAVLLDAAAAATAAAARLVGLERQRDQQAVALDAARRELYAIQNTRWWRALQCWYRFRSGLIGRHGQRGTGACRSEENHGS